MPVYFTGYLPETIQTGGERFSDQSAWWRAERLNMLISADYNAFSGSVQADIRSLEQRFDTEAAVNETIASRLIAEDHRDQAFVILNNQMDRHTMLIQELVERQTAAIQGKLLARGGLCGLRADFLREYSQRVEIPLL